MQDIVESFLKAKCRDVRINLPIQLAASPLPPEKRRNIYVAYHRTLPSIE